METMTDIIAISCGEFHIYIVLNVADSKYHVKTLSQYYLQMIVGHPYLARKLQKVFTII